MAPLRSYAVLRLLRQTRGASLFALVVMLGSVPVSISALLHDAADDACQPRLVAHDESAHRLGAPRTAAPESPHCFVCHWLHSVQTVVTTTSVGAPASTHHQLSVSALPLASAAALEQLAARAPPPAL
jgi:hypothetical protein